MLEQINTLLAPYQPVYILISVIIAVVLGVRPMFRVQRLKNKLIERRLFLDKYHKSKYIKENARRLEAQLILELHQIKQDLYDKKDVSCRCKTNICAYGLKAPKTVEECERMINDLKLWVP